MRALLDRLRGAPRGAAETSTLLLWLAGGAVAVFGVVGALVDLMKPPFGATGLVGLALAGLGAPALFVLAGSVGDRAEGARRLLRWLLLPLAVGLVWGADALVEASPARSTRKVLGWSVAAALAATWVWATLGREDVRALFGPRSLRERLRGQARGLALYGVFVVAAVGAGLAMNATPARALLPHALAELGFMFGALGCGALTTVGAGLAWGVWRAPEDPPEEPALDRRDRP